MSNLELLYEIGLKITNKLDRLYYLTINKELDNTSLEYDSIFDELKLLVLKESNFVSSLKIEDVDICICDLKLLIENNFGVSGFDLNTFDGVEACLNKLNDDYEGDSLYNPDALLRIFYRLTSRSYILTGEGVKRKVYYDDKNFVYYEISIWDAIISELSIMSLKRLKKSFYSLVATTKEEEKVISDLKFNLEGLKLRVLFSNFASEIKAICANNDLDKIEVTDMDKFRKLENFEADMYASLLLERAKTHIDTLSNIEYLNDLISSLSLPIEKWNPGFIFNFKEEVASFEILALNMDLETLKEIYDYSLKHTNEENNSCMSGINNFVKARIKKKEK